MINNIICNRYKILDHLGTGGMATVWLGYDTILDRKVAIKTFKIDANDTDAVKRFNREAKAVTSLSHPNIVSIYDVENEGDFYYLILEYVEGMTLKDYMAKNPKMPVETIVHIAKQIADGLSHAHQNGIIHRDIKPQNILMNNDLTCKITDFGIARAYGDTTLTQTNQMLGTVYYLSPEQARGNVATAQSDIYSLGILIFEMITGQIPFKGESAVAIALKHLQEELPDIDRYRENVPQSVKNIVLKATMKNPNERYISSKELAVDLSTVLNPERLYENKYTGFKISDTKYSNTQNYNQTQYVDVRDIESSYANTSYQNQEFYDDYNDNEKHTQDRYNKNKGSYKNNYSDKKEKEKTSRAKHIILAILAIIAIVVGSFFAYNYIIGADSVSVPDVKNKTVEEAKVSIVKAGLEVGDITEVASDDVKENTVIETDPKAGKKIRKGSKVDLRVSSGKKTVDMPNYIGLDEDTAKRNAAKLGFKNITVEKVESNMKKAFGSKFNIGVMHGKMKSAEKELIMQEFKQKKIDILVSTTVIEVGVDVENATMIVIFDADRFGLSTLHQLRGRVGRSSLESKCILISNTDKERLNIMTKTTDGFKISEEDFKLRGSGDLFGTKQSGDMSFKLANLKRDYNLLIDAKKDTEEFLKDKSTGDIELKLRLIKMVNDNS